MKKTGFNEAQNIGTLRQMETGVPVSWLCHARGMSSTTIYKARLGHCACRPSANARSLRSRR